jgi:dethiobiotin synthetase
MSGFRAGLSKGVMVAATKQHVGKTTSCLALMSGLRKKLGERVGFLKPVGQRHVLVGQNLKVDKDVRLFKEYFNLSTCDYEEMSPVVIPAGYTRNFLDGLIKEEQQVNAIKQAFARISAKNVYTVVEGTGHCGVGSIVNLDNARVASLLGLDMILIVNGGLGAAFDELALNRLMCQHHGVKIRGVLVNKVMHDKVGMIAEYFEKALRRWDIPLIGVVPDASYLGSPTMLDFEQLFETDTLCGKPETKLWHFNQTTLVAMGLGRFIDRLHNEKHSKTLFVTHSSRVDILLAFIAHGAVHAERWGAPWRAGLILAGEMPRHSLPDSMLAALNNQTSPILHANRSTYDAMVMLTNYTAKLSALDSSRTTAAIEHYEPHINFDQLLAQ